MPSLESEAKSSPAAIEYLKFVLQNEKQFFDVLMLFEQDINDLWHR
jgi:hypothetical protein